jgi:hypothetical protein
VIWRRLRHDENKARSASVCTVGPGKVVVVGESQNLLDWSSAQERVVLVSEIPNGDGTSTMTWRSARPIAEVPHEFLRMEASILRFPFR